MACRHCHGGSEFLPAAQAAGEEAHGSRQNTIAPALPMRLDNRAASYMERLVYGSSSAEQDEEGGSSQMQRVLEWVECKATACTDAAAPRVVVPMPGVVIWCKVRIS